MTLPFAKRISLRFLISVAVWCIAAFPLIAQTTSILSSPIERQGIHSSDQGIKLVFTEPLIETSKPIYDALQKNNDLQDFVTALSDLFLFPRPFEIRGEDCDETNYPSPSSSLPIHLCYGLIRQTALIDNGMSQEAQDAQISAAALYSILNYLAPALVSQFDLKISEDDKPALSELAGVLALSVGDAIKDDTLEDLARTAQDIAAAEESQEIKPYWILSGHTSAQADTLACMIYGSNPSRFADLSMNEDSTSASPPCDAMFSQKMEYWSSLLDAHYKK